MIPQSRAPADEGPLLLIVNPMRHGHASAYAGTLALWGLSRGYRVLHAGADVSATGFGRACAHDPRVAFRLTQGAALGLADVRALQEASGAALTVHLGADEWLFTSHEMFAESAEPLPNTWAVLTFAGREATTGQPEPYGLRLAAVLGRGLLAGAFTLDEYQAAQDGPGRLHWLPDPCRELLSAPPAGAERELSGRIRTFLDGAQGPVLPVLGKRDRRKNVLWLARAAVDDEATGVIVLGERAAGEAPWEEAGDEAGEEYELFRWLEARGRAFVHEGYLPGDRQFLAVLAHRAVRGAALPYRCHYGSSGIQLLAHRCGKPALAPDQGLMARRIAECGLGLTYEPGDEANFRAQLARLLREGGDVRAIRHFARHFRTPQVFAALDAMLRDCPAPTAPPWASRVSRPARGLAWAWAHAPQTADEARFLFRLGLDLVRLYRENGRTEEALSELSALLRGATGGAPDTLDHLEGANVLDGPAWEALGALLANMGQPGEAVRAFERAVALAPDQWDWRLYLSDALRYAGRNEAALAALARLAALAPAHPGLRHKQGQALTALGRNEEALARFQQEPETSRWHGAAQEWAARLTEAAPVSNRGQ